MNNDDKVTSHYTSVLLLLLLPFMIINNIKWDDPGEVILFWWSYCDDSVVGKLLAGACMTYDRIYSSKSGILWAWAVIYWIWLTPWEYPEIMSIWLTLLPSREKKCLLLIKLILRIKLILWIEMILLVCCKWWNQQKTYLVSDRLVCIDQLFDNNHNNHSCRKYTIIVWFEFLLLFDLYDWLVDDNKQIESCIEWNNILLWIMTIKLRLTIHLCCCCCCCCCYLS